MSKVNAINASSAVNYGPMLPTQRQGRDNANEYVGAMLNRLYNQTLSVSRTNSLNFRGLKKIVEKGKGEKLDKVV